MRVANPELPPVPPSPSSDPHEREVYVGDLKAGTTSAAVRAAFEELFAALPEYGGRYGHLCSPVVQISVPSVKTGRINFLFVEFADKVLASTALNMSGLRIAGRSVKVCHPNNGLPSCTPQPGLDLQVLRERGDIPWAGGPGAQLLCEVWIGGLGRREKQVALAADLSKALLALPAVRARFPDLHDAVLGVQQFEGGAYAFAELAHELLASTAVSLGSFELSDGRRVKTAWPSSRPDGVASAPPSLARSVDVIRPTREHLAEGAECEVFLGGVPRGVEAAVVWAALATCLTSLPGYSATHGEVASPIVNLRTGSGNFAFARLADAVLASTAIKLGSLEVAGRLASTAIKLGSLEVAGRQVRLHRPSHYKTPEGGDVAPLPLEPTAGLKPTTQPAGPVVGAAAPAPVAAELPIEPPLGVRAEAAAGSPAEAPIVSPPPPPPLPPPPPPPPQRVARLWIGNLEADFPTLATKEQLDEHLTRLALASPDFDVDSGPPLKRVSVHQSGRFAFVDLCDGKLAQRLIAAWDGCEFRGRPLSVNWAHRRPWCSDVAAVPSPTVPAQIDRGEL